jgi:hypothetical protein
MAAKRCGVQTKAAPVSPATEGAVEVAELADTRFAGISNFLTASADTG